MCIPHCLVVDDSSDWYCISSSPSHPSHPPTPLILILVSFRSHGLGSLPLVSITYSSQPQLGLLSSSHALSHLSTHLIMFHPFLLLSFSSYFMLSLWSPSYIRLLIRAYHIFVLTHSPKPLLIVITAITLISSIADIAINLWLLAEALWCIWVASFV